MITGRSWMITAGRSWTITAGAPIPTSTWKLGVGIYASTDTPARGDTPGGVLHYRDVYHQNEVEQSTYNFEHSDVEFLLTAFGAHEIRVQIDAAEAAATVGRQGLLAAGVGRADGLAVRPGPHQRGGAADRRPQRRRQAER